MYYNKLSKRKVEGQKPIIPEFIWYLRVVLAGKSCLLERFSHHIPCRQLSSLAIRTGFRISISDKVMRLRWRGAVEASKIGEISQIEKKITCSFMVISCPASHHKARPRATTKRVQEPHTSSW